MIGLAHHIMEVPLFCKACLGSVYVMCFCHLTNTKNIEQFYCMIKSPVIAGDGGRGYKLPVII